MLSSLLSMVRVEGASAVVQKPNGNDTFDITSGTICTRQLQNLEIQPKLHLETAPPQPEIEIW